jgi:hypothetical protein
VFLVWVLVQVEQLLGAVLASPDGFEMTVGQRVKRLGLAVARCVFEVQPIACHTPLAAQHWYQVPTVNTLRRSGMCQFGQRGQDVFETDRLVALSGRLEAQRRRRGDDERDIGRAFVRFAFADVTVVAQHLAVVGGDDDHPRAPGPLAPRLEVAIN